MKLVLVDENFMEISSNMTCCQREELEMNKHVVDG